MKPVTIHTALALLASACMLSCNDSQPRSYVEYYHPRPALIFASDVATSGQRNPAHGKPGHRCDLPKGALLPSTENLSIPASAATEAFAKAQQNLPSSQNSQTSANTATSAAGLNPAHGQPGHRCDMPVGAPLNSAPANTNLKNTSTATAKTDAGSPQLNPSHGQPGHRCDIAVGAPLNSPPATTIKPTTAAPPVTVNTPATTDSSQILSAILSDSSSGSVRLNPPHGQPGHDCTIAVGKPLKQ